MTTNHLTALVFSPLMRKTTANCFRSSHSASLLIKSIIGKMGLVLMLGASLTAQKTISVHAVDFETGKPIGNIPMTYTFWNGSSYQTAVGTAQIVSSGTLKTNNDGKMSLTIPEPLPNHLKLFSLDTVNPIIVDADPSQIIESGMLVPYGHAHSNIKLSAQSGEIQILTRKLTAWRKIKREFP